jgi:hypothetical protein
MIRRETIHRHGSVDQEVSLLGNCPTEQHADAISPITQTVTLEDAPDTRVVLSPAILALLPL